jgi:DNA polymerase-3 subunit alpha
LLEDLEISNARDRFPFAGMVRSLEAKITKTGKPFGVLVLEDFTGSAEIMLWLETFVPARDAGLLEPGKAVKLKCAVQVDDRTGGHRLTGYDVCELKPKQGAGNGKGPLELVLWTTRHSERDLLEIREVLGAHPGTTPVWLHFQNSAGRRLTIAAHESFNVNRSDALEAALARWLED